MYQGTNAEEVNFSNGGMSDQHLVWKYPYDINKFKKERKKENKRFIQTKYLYNSFLFTSCNFRGC